MIMISQYEAIKSKNCTKIQTIDIFDLGRGVLPNIFSFFFFLRREGEKECLIHFFTSRQPPSAINKSTHGWPVEARKMAATKYFFAQLGKSKQWLLLFLEELAQDYFSVMKKYQLEFQPTLLLATVTIDLFTYRSYYIHLFCK